MDFKNVQIKQRGDFKEDFCTNMSQTIYYSFPCHSFLVSRYTPVSSVLSTVFVSYNREFNFSMLYEHEFGYREKSNEKSFMGFVCTVYSSRIGFLWILLPQIYSLLLAQVDYILPKQSLISLMHFS